MNNKPSFMVSTLAGTALATALGLFVSGCGKTEDDPTPGSTPTGATAATGVVLSELMYHPAGEDTEEDLYEFIEIYNRGTEPVSIAGWKIAGKKMKFSFAAGRTIKGKQYLVIAKNQAKLLKAPSYKEMAPPLLAADIAGEYSGQLDNGSDTITLFDAAGLVLDTVTYKTKAPWPIGADALGAGRGWQSEDLTPSLHKGMGMSLERISMNAPTDVFWNWDASDIDGATPGRQNTAASRPGALVATVTALGTASKTKIIRKDETVNVSTTFAGPPGMKILNPRIEYFIVAMESLADPVYVETPLVKQADGSYVATVPAQPENSVVRYRVKADRGSGDEILSPRWSDPFDTHAYFVSPEIQTKATVYQVFITQKNWTQLWDNISPGANNGCKMNDLWQTTLPATFVTEGKVWDVRIRFQGSRFQRTNGLVINDWKAVGPMRPSPMKVLSFKVAFPRYDDFQNNQRAIYLNKMAQGCPGVEAYIGTKLHAAAGGYGFDVNFARVHVNGAYYHYMGVFEEPTDGFFKRRNEPVGDLFKVHGAADEQAKYGKGDGSLLKDNCGFTPQERYATTYTRKTNDWKQGQMEVKELLEGLEAAKKTGIPELRKYLEEQFDVDAMLGYIAVRNWAGAWDDVIHNQYLYRRPNKKWLVIPWDYDVELGQASFQPFGGGEYKATLSFIVGLEGNPENRLGPNYLKSAFLQAYRPEYEERLQSLSKTLLNPTVVHGLVDQYLKVFSQDDWKQTPGRVAGSTTLSCDPNVSAARIKQWSFERERMLQTRSSK